MMFLNEDEDLVLQSDGTETKAGDQIIAEALIEDACLEYGETLDEAVLYDLINEDVLNERNIIKWDKKTKRKYNTNKSVIVLAKEKNDRDYKKLVKVYKMRKILLDRLNKKYYNKAKIRARKMESTHGVSKAIASIKGKASVKGTDMPKK